MIPREGLVAEYLFNGNSADTSGRGRHGVVHGATLTADRHGRVASAYRFDGIDDEIVVAPPPLPGPSGLSVSVWACFDRRKLGGWSNCIIAQDDGDDENPSRRVFQLSAHDRHIVWHRMTCARDPQCRRRIRFREWYHLVATCEHGRHTLYVDGERQDAVEDVLRSHAEQPLHIGRKGTPERCFYFRGAIDDVRVYDRALNPEEIQALFEEDGFLKPLRPPPAGPDPISGRWGQQGITFLDLQLAGEGSLTGNVMNGRPDRRADIESGRFERKTGAVHLEGTAPHHRTGKPFRYVIEGVLDDGELTVTASFGGWSGNLSFTRNGARWPWRHTLARRLNTGIRRVLGLGDLSEG